jgi:hypothetical protein
VPRWQVSLEVGQNDLGEPISPQSTFVYYCHDTGLVALSFCEADWVTERAPGVNVTAGSHFMPSCYLYHPKVPFFLPTFVWANTWTIQGKPEPRIIYEDLKASVRPSSRHLDAGIYLWIEAKGRKKRGSQRVFVSLRYTAALFKESSIELNPTRSGIALPVRVSLQSYSKVRGPSALICCRQFHLNMHLGSKNPLPWPNCSLDANSYRWKHYILVTSHPRRRHWST